MRRGLVVGERAEAWERALNLTGEGSSASFGKPADMVLCRICERQIMARLMAEHTRCCVLASQVTQEAEMCDSRLAALSSKLTRKIEERRELAAEAEPLPLARGFSLTASFFSALSQLWMYAALWALTALVFVPKLERWRKGGSSSGGGGSSSSSGDSGGDSGGGVGAVATITKSTGGTTPVKTLAPLWPSPSRRTTARSPLAAGAGSPPRPATSPGALMYCAPTSPTRPSHTSPTSPKAAGHVTTAADGAVGATSSDQGAAGFDELMNDTSLLEAANAALGRLSHYATYNMLGPNSGYPECEAAVETLQHVQQRLEQLDDFSGSTLVGGAAALALERVRMLHALADAEIGADSGFSKDSAPANAQPPIPARGSGSWHGLDQIEAVSTAEALEAEMVAEAAAEAEEAAAEEAVAARIANSPGRINVERIGGFVRLDAPRGMLRGEEPDGEATQTPRSTENENEESEEEAHPLSPANGLSASSYAPAAACAACAGAAMPACARASSAPASAQDDEPLRQRVTAPPALLLPSSIVDEQPSHRTAVPPSALGGGGANTAPPPADGTRSGAPAPASRVGVVVTERAPATRPPSRAHVPSIADFQIIRAPSGFQLAPPQREVVHRPVAEPQPCQPSRLLLPADGFLRSDATWHASHAACLATWHATPRGMPRHDVHLHATWHA